MACLCRCENPVCESFVEIEARLVCQLMHMGFHFDRHYTIMVGEGFSRYLGKERGRPVARTAVQMVQRKAELVCVR